MSLTKAETKIGKAVYAAIVILLAVGFPLLLLTNTNTNISKIELNVFTVLVTLFYIVVVIGFVFLIFKIKSIRIKVLEIDNKTQGQLRKFYLFIMVLGGINIVYSSVKIIFELWK